MRPDAETLAAISAAATEASGADHVHRVIEVGMALLLVEANVCMDCPGNTPDAYGMRTDVQRIRA